jgi:uncharacterized protein YaiI (UPF0178 family)
MARVRPKKIWIDADACPKIIKDMILKVGNRLKIKIVLVANSYLNVTCSDLVQVIVVSKEFDAADLLIIEQVEIHDLVITADIPLAAQVLKKKAIAINPRGEIYNLNTIGSILSMRHIMKEFYDAGTLGGDQAPFGPKDVKQFADSLNRLTS